MKENIKRMIENMKNNEDGCSINPRTGETVLPENGYFVAITDNEMTSDDETEIVKLGTMAAFLNIGEYFLGYWKDAKTDKRFLDLSVHIKDKVIAMELAKIHNQKAIFDCANIDSIYC